MKIFHGVLRSGNFKTNRLDAFSDGVFAIVITLLVLDLHVPEIKEIHSSQELIEGLVRLLPKFLSYILSFFYISIYWVNHHQLFHIIQRSDRGLFWLNSLFLMFLTFIPFPTALIGAYPNNYVAVMFYGAAMFVTAVSFGIMKWYTVEIGHLVDPEAEPEFLKQSLFKIAIGPVLYLLAFLVAGASTQAAITIYVIIPFIYFFPSEFEKELSNKSFK